MPEASIAAQARARGISPQELAYDLMLDRDGRNQLYLAVANYGGGSLSASYEMLSELDIVPGLGDGGAHYGTICDSSYSTYLLSHWARDRSRGPRLPLPHVVRMRAHATAQLMGMNDRGLVAPGYKADLNVIDFDRLRLHPPEIRRDLPAGGRRLVQRADGYTATPSSTAWRSIARARRPAPCPAAWCRGPPARAPSSIVMPNLNQRSRSTTRS